MERLNALAEGLKHVAGLLGEDVLEPDAARTDWAELTVRVGMAREGLEQVLAALDGALEDAEDADSKALVRQRTAEMTGRTAALVLATGDAAGGQALLERALRIAEAPEQRAKLEAGLADPVHFGLYEHAGWAWGRGRPEVARALFQRVARKSRQKTLQKLARGGLQDTDPSNHSRPIQKAPPLLRINGCGVGLYGKRDEAPDGTYVTTYFISLLFLPVLPLTAYRVRRVDGNAYQFFTREPLGWVTRLWRRLGLVGLVGTLAWSSVDGYLNAPERVAQLYLEETQRMEATLSREDTLLRYRTLIEQFEVAPVRHQAAEAVMRLSFAQLPSPCTLASGETVGRALGDVIGLYGESFTEEMRSRLAERVAGCAGEIGHATVEQTRMALELVDKAREVSGTHPALRTRREALALTLGDQLSAERPLRALALYAPLPGDKAREAARTLIDSLGEDPSTWVESSAAIESWLARADVDAASADARRYRERLDQARAAHARDEALIAEGDEAKLVQAHKAAPGNQALAGALAHRALARGDAAAAVALVEGFGPAGRLTDDAQVLLAICHRVRGRLAEADAVLSSLVAERLAPYQSARRQYKREEHAVREEITHGEVPPELNRRVNATSHEGTRTRILREWIIERIKQDPRLQKLREDLVRQQKVVSASVLWGLVKLQRASTAPGETRAALLGEAERVLLSVREEAEEDPFLHLGLGQVYHRLGRSAEGDGELRAVVARGDPKLTLQVAEAYRELNQPGQARSLSETVYATAQEESVRHLAALGRAKVATDEDEREQWLLKSDAASPAVRSALRELRARRAQAGGMVP